jgi:hypothetical protein
MGRIAQRKGNIFSQDEIPGTEFSFFQILLEMPPKKSMQIILLLIHHAIHLFICLFIVHQ